LTLSQDYANAIAIGAQSKAQAKYTTAVGGFSQATKQDASAFGQQAYAWGEESTATGTMSQAWGRFSTVDGAYAHAEADNSSAFGGYAYATKAQATALGTSSQATENNSTAVGAFSKASSNGGVAVGAFSNANRNAGTAAYLTNEKSTLGAVSVGDNTKGYTRQITGVAGGSEDTDAVNVAQLKQVYAVANQNIGDISNTVTNIDNRVNDLGNKVDNLDNRMDRVGASAAALAALHPLDFDPDAKWDFAAGYGNYKGANAAAIGAFYRPNEDTMFSVGGSFSGGENMVNAGLSLKIGQGNHVSTSRVAMAKKIVDQDKRIQALTDQVAQLTAHLNAFMEKDCRMRQSFVISG
jgi:archaellum component FlaC